MKVKREDKVTVQGLNNPVPAAEQGDQAGPLSSLSSDRNVTGVVNLASVPDKATSSNDEEGEEGDAVIDRKWGKTKKPKLHGKKRRAVALLRKDRQKYTVEEYTKAYKLLTGGKSPPLEHLLLGNEQANGSVSKKMNAGAVAGTDDHVSQGTSKRAASGPEYHFLKKKKLDAEEPVPTIVPGIALDEDLTLAIIDENAVCGQIPRRNRLQVEEAINEELAKYISEADVSKPAIQIESIHYFRDELVVQVATKECVGTLKTLIERMPPPFKGAKLRLVRMGALLAQTKMKFLVNGVGSQFTSDEILKIMARQNKDVPVGRWEVFRREDGENESRLIVGLDHVSMTSLAKTQGKVYFLTSTVTLNVAKSVWKKESLNAQCLAKAQ